MFFDICCGSSHVVWLPGGLRIIIIKQIEKNPMTVFNIPGPHTMVFCEV